MSKLSNLAQNLQAHIGDFLTNIDLANGELCLECNLTDLTTLLRFLRDTPKFAFAQLIDLCAVDYLLYGEYDWETESTTTSGFSRGVEKQAKVYASGKPRFAVVYHLLSTKNNQRIRVKTFVAETNLVVPSVIFLWRAANWYEREAYDLYGILFDGHPDLRRILTDYGFIGHPFRKDFPLIGQVEMRYDAALARVIYEPVNIEPRTLVPKVIRNDNRYYEELTKNK